MAEKNLRTRGLACIGVLLAFGSVSFAQTVSFDPATNFAAGTYPYSVAMGDLNGDGKPDLAVANRTDDNVSILLGTGTGAFGAATNFAVGTQPASVAIGDLNGDGKPDLAVANRGSDNVSILLGTGTGAFGSAASFAVEFASPSSVAIGDLNGDGKPDLAVAKTGFGSDDNVSILLSDGTGAFGSATNFDVGRSPYSVAIGDLNGDGKPDVAVANLGNDNVSILLGDGTGAFGVATNFGVGGLPFSVAIGDLNGDGKPDLAVANLGTDNVSILLGDGTGAFSSATNFAVGSGPVSGPVSVAIGDLNGDGKPDLAVANANSNDVSILLNTGDGAFGPATNFAVGSSPTSVAIGDLNGDGKPDLAVANNTSNNVSVLLNTTTFDPVGTFAQVSAGWQHTCAVKSDGTVACWGYNGYGETTPPAGTFIQVTVGSYHTCALKSDGTVACWGSNFYGEATPPGGTFAQISSGPYHNCGRKSDGTVACWGNNNYGQTTSPAGAFAQVSAGYDFTCGMKSDRTVACWGNSSLGRLTAPAGTFTQIDAGGGHTCGFKSDGTLACWGDNGSEQATPPAGTFSQVSAGGAHTCGVKGDGTLACWGDNSYGEAAPPAGTFAQVSAGHLTTCGVKSDHTLACWGDNSDGQATPRDNINITTGMNIVTQPVDSTIGTAPATLTFDEVTQSGTITLTTSTSGTPPPSGFQLGDPPTYYEIQTTASFSGPIKVCINYTGVTFPDESSLKLFHYEYEDGLWVDHTISLDTVNNIICASVTSLSPFAIFAPANATIKVYSALHTMMDSGSTPKSTKTALSLSLKVFDLTKVGPPTPEKFGGIWTGTTGLISDATISVAANVNFGGGKANLYTIVVPPNRSYLVIGQTTGINPPIYLGSPTDQLTPGSTTQKYLQLIKDSSGQFLPATTTKVTGSLLLITQPESLVFTSSSALLPIIYESVDGDWSAVVQASPPEGFVSTPGAITADVTTSTMDAVQFTIKDVGSSWTSTRVTHRLKHKGRDITVMTNTPMVNKQPGGR
jgi:alpha-tubulin suppressor-like RCC1 family protein